MATRPSSVVRSFLVASTLVAMACGSGSSSSNGSDAGNGSDAALNPFPGFDFQLTAGTYWQFGWSYKYTSGSPSGSSVKQDGGLLRLTLGAPVSIQGIQAFPVEATGDLADLDKHSYVPRWKYLAIDSNRILGSTDGATFQPIFDAKGSWTGGGFFATFGDTLNVTAVASSMSNGFVSTNALAMSRAAGQSFCDYISGILICDNDTAYTVQESDYMKGGIGPLGYDSYVSYSSNGGGFYTSFTYDRKIGLVGTSLAAADGWVPKPIPWARRGDMPRRLAQHTAVAIGNKIYVMGGTDESNTMSDAVHIYDTDSDAWSLGMPMPAARSNHAAAALAGHIFVLGGLSNAVWEYDPSSNTWATRSNAPVGVTGPAAADEEDGELVLFTDCNCAYVSPVDAYAYDPVGDQWSRTSSPIPNYDRVRAAVALGGKYYVFGGYDCLASSFTSHMQALALAPAGSNDTWTARAHVLTPRAWMASAVANGHIFAIGGNNGTGVLPVVEAYEPATDSWATKYPMFKVRSEVAAATVNGKIYVIGGVDSSGPTATVLVYDPALDP